MTYIEAKSYNIAEVTGRRPVRDLLMALTEANVETHLMTFADNHLMNLTDGTDMYVLIEQYQSPLLLTLFHRTNSPTVMSPVSLLSR
jgi:hypothetical protein